ncbi:MAG TPA: ATP-binding protein [Gemmatimonadaceae bacterium]|nr:ATP-binding protein [Gemmatimonadaceae bacterium]
MTATRPEKERRSQRRLDQDRLRAIVDKVGDGIVVVGLDGAIRFANPAAEELFGRSLKQLTGADLGLPAVAGDATEIEIVRPRGGSVAVELRVVETEWDREQVRLVSLRDVTDRRRAHERQNQLERERIARAEAEAASHAKSEFLATMSHELRTPLNAVIGYSELLDLGIAGSLTPVQHKHVLRIRDSARHLLGLVNEVLDLSKVEAGRLAVQTRAARVADAVDAALALVQPAAEQRGITLVSDCAMTDTMYEGDVDRVRQIVLNLLNNAVKFTAPGGTITVESGVEQQLPAHVKMQHDAGCAFIRVRDTGVGIPRERLASIFDPFVQVEGGHTRSSDGSGLGLTISRRLARLMGGDLTVTSEPQRGSTFTLWLRIASSEQREAARWRSESPDTAARLQGLGDIGRGLLRGLPDLMERFVDQLRQECIVPGAPNLRASQLGDHVTTYVADLATMLIAIEEARGQPTQLVADGAEIQLQVAEKHGQQRARLGWTTDTLRREWAILREEIVVGVRRAAASVDQRVLTEAIAVLERFIEQGEEASCRALVRAGKPLDSTDA